MDSKAGHSTVPPHSREGKDPEHVGTRGVFNYFISAQKELTQAGVKEVEAIATVWTNFAHSLCHIRLYVALPHSHNHHPQQRY